jgi:hypothetical protein
MRERDTRINVALEQRRYVNTEPTCSTTIFCYREYFPARGCACSGHEKISSLPISCTEVYLVFLMRVVLHLVLIALSSSTDPLLAEDEVEVTSYFGVDMSITRSRSISKAPFRINIGSTVTYSHSSYLQGRFGPIEYDGVIYSARQANLMVEQYDGQVYTMTDYIDDEKFRIEGHNQYLEYGMAFTDAPGRSTGFAGDIGIGPLGFKRSSPDSYQQQDFTIFPDRNMDSMKILFTPTISPYMVDKLRADICFGPLHFSPGESHASLPGKYILSGTVTVVSRSSSIRIAFETIHNFVEVPTHQFDEFLELIISVGGVEVVNHASGRISFQRCPTRLQYDGYLPRIIIQFGPVDVTIGPESYLLFPESLRSTERCLLAVRPQRNPEFLIAGGPFLRNAVFAVARTDGIRNSIGICNA